VLLIADQAIPGCFGKDRGLTSAGINISKWMTKSIYARDLDQSRGK